MGLRGVFGFMLRVLHLSHDVAATWLRDIRSWCRILGAPGADELSLLLRGFLIKLSALDGQLVDNKGQFTPRYTLHMLTC